MTVIHEQLKQTPHGTMLTEFKRALIKFKRHGFTTEQKGCSKVADLCDYMDRLLNDDLMMTPHNNFTFEQRTMMVQINFFKLCFFLMCDDDYHDLHADLKELCKLLPNTVS